MSESLVALAVFEGFWGQIFEYWPFFLTVGATLVFGAISIGADLWWRKEIPPPEGALPRVEIPVDPRVPFRRWISRGRTMLRFGSGIGIFFGFIYASFAISPQGLNDQFGLQQETDPELVAGSLIALGALIVAFASTVYLRNRLQIQLGVLVVAAVLAMISPWVVTGDITKLFASAGVVGTPVLFMTLGIGYTYYGMQGLRALARPPGGTAPASSQAP